MTWDAIAKGGVKVELPVSMQFRHTRMDGAQAAEFLARLQAEINRLKL